MINFYTGGFSTMGKKKYVNPRAAQAHRRNVEQAAYRKKQAATKALWDKHGKKIITAIVAAVVLIIAIWLGCKFFVGPNGSLPNFFGELRGVQDNWIVTNTGSSSRPTYYHFGSFDTPEGFTWDPDYRISTNDLSKTLYFEANAEDSIVDHIYVSGVRNQSAQEQMDALMAYAFHKENSEPVTANVGGHDTVYAYFVYNNMDENGEETSEYYASITAYVNTVQDSCVLVLLNTPVMAKEELPTQEALVAELEKVLPLLTLPE